RRHLDAALSAPPPPYSDPPLFAEGRMPRPARNRNDAPPVGPSRRLCLLLARLADAEEGPARIGEWFDRAAAALPDPRYVCAGCGGESFDWHALCPHCGRFDALAWRTPARTPPLPEAAEPGATAEESRSQSLTPVPAEPAERATRLAPTAEPAKTGAADAAPIAQR
ncbi:MAG TPA: hypothetical protein VJ770_27505, partial [Stellaceae bacterium]|nr:hypothetical protein [Stellaceae bacterium]